MNPPEPLDDSGRWSSASAFRRGARDALGIPLLVLMATFTGYTGLAREAGFDLPQVLVMTGLIWALPAQVVLLSAIAAGASLPAAALAVGLSGVRLMPMVVAILPELKTARTRTSTLILISCYTAVTSWVIGMERLRGIPREWRTAWFLGVQATLVAANLAVAVAVFVLVVGMPPLASAALAFLMPVYFLTSLWNSARENAGLVAMVAGLLAGPALHGIAPGFDLVAAGMIGGLAGWMWHRRERAGR